MLLRLEWCDPGLGRCCKLSTASTAEKKLSAALNAVDSFNRCYKLPAALTAITSCRQMKPVGNSFDSWKQLSTALIAVDSFYSCQSFRSWNQLNRDFSRLRISEFTHNFWVFSVYIADFFWVIWENGSNLRLKMSVSALGWLKNHNVPHLHSSFTMFMPLNGF